MNESLVGYQLDREGKKKNPPKRQRNSLILKHLERRAFNLETRKPRTISYGYFSNCTRLQAGETPSLLTRSVLPIAFSSNIRWAFFEWDDLPTLETSSAVCAPQQLIQLAGM